MPAFKAFLQNSPVFLIVLLQSISPTGMPFCPFLSLMDSNILNTQRKRILS